MIWTNLHYKRRYYKFIEHYKHTKAEGYVEKHHIEPKSMGGSDHQSNLVELPARAHYLAHWMLAKGTEDNRMKLAFQYMAHSTKGNFVPCATAYEAARIAASKVATEKLTGKPSRRQKYPDELIALIFCLKAKGWPNIMLAKKIDRLGYKVPYEHGKNYYRFDNLVGPSKMSMRCKRPEFVKLLLKTEKMVSKCYRNIRPSSKFHRSKQTSPNARKEPLQVKDVIPSEL